MTLLLHASSPSLYGSLCLSFQTLKSSNPISVLWMLFSVLMQLPILPWHPMYEGLLARTWLEVSAPLRNALKSSSPISVLWLVFSAVSWSASTRFPGETKPPHVRWRFRFADVFEPLRTYCSLLLGASMGNLWLPVRNPQAVPAEPPHWSPWRP